ncbi:MAG: hypothetical protein KAI42_05880 [Dehalococcoidales bacterium]|nr:hypothetical protein [Dehalococcoidales bacterium]
MNVLKGLALGLLSFLLVLSLSIFGVAFLLNQTILNPGFVSSEINKLDVPLLAEELLREQIPEEELVAEVLSDTITNLEPWIQQQVTDGVYFSYDYLTGRSQSLSVVIPLDPVKESLKDNVEEVILQILPPELAGASPAQIELFLNELYSQIDELLPATFEISESSLPPDVLSTLEMVKQIISYFQVAYNLMIGLIVLLIVGIILIDRQIIGTTRKLGAILLPEGILMLVGVFVAKYLAGTQIAQFDIPTYLQEWLPQLVSDFVAPLLMLGIGFLVVGVALLTFSFVYKRQT